MNRVELHTERTTEHARAGSEVDPEASALWKATLEKLTALLGGIAVESWLGSGAVRPLRIKDNCRLVLKPANPIVADWISENFAEVVNAALMAVSGTTEAWTLEFDPPDDPDFALR